MMNTKEVSKVGLKIGIFIFTVILLINLASCTSNNFTIEGKYVTYKNKHLDGFKIQFTLQDANKKFSYYKIDLKKDGGFKFRIKEKGIFVLYVSLLDYPRDLWRDPILSNHSTYYEVETDKENGFRLKNIYISDAINILAPNGKVTIDLSNDFTFRWESNPLAETYSFSIFRIEGTQRHAVLTVFGINNNEINLSKLLDLTPVEGEINFDKIIQLGMFKRNKEELKPGEYGISVSGYVEDADNRRFLEVTHSQSTYETLVIFR